MHAMYLNLMLLLSALAGCGFAAGQSQRVPTTSDFEYHLQVSFKTRPEESPPTLFCQMLAKNVANDDFAVTTAQGTGTLGSVRMELAKVSEDGEKSVSLVLIEPTIVTKDYAAINTPPLPVPPANSLPEFLPKNGYWIVGRSISFGPSSLSPLTPEGFTDPFTVTEDGRYKISFQLQRLAGEPLVKSVFFVVSGMGLQSPSIAIELDGKK